MKIYKGKKTEETITEGLVVEVFDAENEVVEVSEHSDDIPVLGDAAMNELSKVSGTSNSIKQQSLPKSLFSGNKNIKALAENDAVISRVLKNVLDWLLLVTSATTIRREEYEDLTEQMLKFEDDVTNQLELQVKFKRAFEQIQQKQREQNELLQKLGKMRIWLMVTTGVSVVALLVAVVALVG